MKIEYTDHALDRLFERKISKRAVKEAIRNGKKENVSDGLIKAILRNNNQSLVVLYYMKGIGEFTVVTAYHH